MNPLKRNNPNVRATDHEDRIQALERRHAADFPQWGSALMDQITVQAADVYPFGWAFPGDDPCVLPDCDPTDWRTQGNYLLLPLGLQCAFKVYMTASCLGGCGQLSEYYEVTDPSTTSINGQSFLGYTTEVWRDDEPFGFVSLKTYRAWGEHPPPVGSVGVERYWWYMDMVTGQAPIGANDRYALLPWFSLFETLPGNMNVGGLMFAVEVQPPDQSTGGFAI